MREYFRRPKNDSRWPWDTFRADVVAVWARSHHLEADWLVDRVAPVAGYLYQQRFMCSGQPPDPTDPDLWKSFEIEDRDLMLHEKRRARVPYNLVLSSDLDPLAPQHKPGAEYMDSPFVPLVAWPDVESREEFQKRALRHYDRRAALARNAGLGSYRKAPALERHAVWLLQKRVLGMSLDSIADLAQQERETRRRGASAWIEARSVSREIKKLERLLPL